MSVTLAGDFGFLSRFVMVGTVKGHLLPTGLVTLLYMGIRFHFFWPEIRSGFTVVPRIWSGVSLKFFVSYTVTCNVVLQLLNYILHTP